MTKKKKKITAEKKIKFFFWSKTPIYLSGSVSGSGSETLHSAGIESFPSNPLTTPCHAIKLLLAQYSLCGCGMALKLKAKQEKCTYAGVENLQAYSLQEKRGYFCLCA
jgi:hypothetical protein